MVEVLKQPQYSPMHVIDQVMIIFAGTRATSTRCRRAACQAGRRTFLEFVQDAVSRDAPRRHWSARRSMTDEIAADLKAKRSAEFKTHSTQPRAVSRLTWSPAERTAARTQRATPDDHEPRTSGETTMAKARAIVKRRKAVENIRKITRTMELIATPVPQGARPRDRGRGLHAQDRRAGRRPGRDSRPDGHASAARAARPGQACAAPGAHQQPRAGRRLQRQRPAAGHATATRNCRPKESSRSLEVAGKRGINFFRFRKRRARGDLHPVRGPAAVRRGRDAGGPVHQALRPGKDRPLDVAYTQFVIVVAADGVVQTLLPITTADIARPSRRSASRRPAPKHRSPAKNGEARPVRVPARPAEILEEIVPVSFKVRLFKCFLDAAVSEQIARMVAMKAPPRTPTT